jgi:hypothetical protein
MILLCWDGIWFLFTSSIGKAASSRQRTCGAGGVPLRHSLGTVVCLSPRLNGSYVSAWYLSSTIQPNLSVHDVGLIKRQIELQKR